MKKEYFDYDELPEDRFFGVVVWIIFAGVILAYILLCLII